MRIDYDKSIEANNRQEIDNCINEFKWLIPKWVQDLNVFVYGTKADNTIAEISANYAYRSLTLNVYGSFFIQDESSKREVILHELCHAHTNIIGNFAYRLIEDLSPEADEPKLNTILNRQWTEAIESVTQDLAFAIMNKFNEQSIEN